ncbi:fimbrial protein [Providencia rustigianii]|uniref:fimbrial protein n=1 Tax=Providencia rustigianii TaxID=158850 RepID=UPI002243BEE9|nr:fimbrial protein [Providencia rustigianii]
MKFNKTIMAIAATSLISFSAFSAPVNHGNGKVTFTGSIISAPCSIDPASLDQTVDLGQIADVVLKNGETSDGQSSPVMFDIKLIDCTVETGDTVNVTFSGAAAENNGNPLLAITGTAGGAGIQIVDSNNAPIVLNEKTKSTHKLQGVTNTLQFAAYIKGLGTLKGASDPVEIIPGEFQAVTVFILTYN